MARTPIWQGIAADLRQAIGQGHYGPGDRLPTEAELSSRFGVNRHTVRQALAALADEGLVHARRGAGVFVMAKPADYPLGRRVRFHRNIAASGRTPARRLTRLESRAADAHEAELLGLDPGALIHVVEGTSLIDEVPAAVFRSIFDAGRFPDLLEHLARSQSVTAALAACGLADYTRASTRLTAKIARGTLALALQVADGAPVLRSEAINVDQDGRVVEHGRTWFAGERVTLTMGPDAEEAP